MLPSRVLLTVSLLLPAVVSCGSGVGKLPPGGERAGDAQNPPITLDGAAIEAWIVGGSYLQWRCEPATHAARSPSPHGSNRICVNAATSSAAASGDYPVGAASVKELTESDGRIIGYSLYARTAAGEGGASRLWYESFGGSVAVLGAAEGGCTGCHGGAPRDFVFTDLR